MTPTARPTQSDDTLPRPPPPPFDIHTMEPIEPPWQAIKEWIPDEEPDLDGVQPSPESFKSRSRRIRPKSHMGTRGNPTRRRQHPGSRIHLTSRQPAYRKTAAKTNLGTAVRRATVAANENRREISRVSRLPANSGGFLTKTPPTEPPTPPPLPPATPFLPPSGPANGCFRGLPQEVTS
jgi:hypothetical protein